MNIQQMMKQAQDMQKKFQEMQGKLSDVEVEGKAGGGAVVIKANAKGEVKGIKLDKSLMQPDEVEILEDLIVAAFNNAKQNAENFVQEEMQKMGLPTNIMNQMPF